MNPIILALGILWILLGITAIICAFLYPSLTRLLITIGVIGLCFGIKWACIDAPNY